MHLSEKRERAYARSRVHSTWIVWGENEPVVEKKSFRGRVERGELKAGTNEYTTFALE